MASNDRSLRRKPPILSGFICIHRNMRRYSALMKRRPSRRWIVRIRVAALPGRAERHGFEYYRHGTLSLYAAFNTKTGEVLGKTAARHTSAEFVAFLTDIVANQPRGKEIRVIADNLSAHKSALVKEFLAANPKVQLHFTPTYSPGSTRSSCGSPR